MYRFITLHRETRLKIFHSLGYWIPQFFLTHNGSVSRNVVLSFCYLLYSKPIEESLSFFNNLSTFFLFPFKYPLRCPVLKTMTSLILLVLLWCKGYEAISCYASNYQLEAKFWKKRIFYSAYEIVLGNRSNLRSYNGVNHNAYLIKVIFWSVRYEFF